MNKLELLVDELKNQLALVRNIQAAIATGNWAAEEMLKLLDPDVLPLDDKLLCELVYPSLGLAIKREKARQAELRAAMRSHRMMMDYMQDINLAKKDTGITDES